MVKAVETKRKIEMKLKKNLSKNRKKGWRKNVEVEDVEKFLEDERLQMRTGGLVSEKPDEELFVIERKQVAESFVPLKKGTKQKKVKNLKCYLPLENHCKIQVPIKPNKVTPVTEKYSNSAKATILKKKKIAANRKLRTSSRLKIDSKPKVYDLWGKDDEAENVDDEIVKHYKRTTNTEPVKVPSFMYQKASLLPAVEVPHAGTSYNPSYDDHQELLMKAFDEEKKKVQAKQKLKRALDDHFPTKRNAPNQETWMEEMSQGLHYDSEDSDSGLDEAELEMNLLHKNPPVRSDQRKLKSKKRKEKLQKIQKKVDTEKKEKKVLENEIFRVKQIKKEIITQEKLTADKSISRSTRRADKLYKPARMGKYRYEAPDLEVALTEELTGSLRQLKPEGHLLEDRFKSFQKRNVLQPTVHQKVKRKYKKKKFTKRGHKVV